MAAHQAPLSLGFSRQEHWSGLPFPSPMHENEKWKWSHSVVSDSSWSHGLQPTRLLHPWDFPGKSTGVGCHCLLHKMTRKYLSGYIRGFSIIRPNQNDTSLVIPLHRHTRLGWCHLPTYDPDCSATIYRTKVGHRIQTGSVTLVLLRRWDWVIRAGLVTLVIWAGRSRRLASWEALWHLTVAMIRLVHANRCAKKVMVQRNTEKKAPLGQKDGGKNLHYLLCSTVVTQTLQEPTGAATAYHSACTTSHSSQITRAAMATVTTNQTTDYPELPQKHLHSVYSLLNNTGNIQCSLRKHAAAAAKSLQSCPTLCDPRDGSPPGSPIPGILQARILEWVAIAFSNAEKWKAKVKSLSRVWLFATPWTAAYQAPSSMGFSRQEYWSRLPLPSLWVYSRHV